MPWQLTDREMQVVEIMGGTTMEYLSVRRYPCLACLSVSFSAHMEDHSLASYSQEAFHQGAFLLSAVEC